jgi:SAM-dependent methyltransferase
MSGLPASFDDEYGRTSARFYDGAYGQSAQVGPDVAFYQGLAREAGGPVLELGCGTGRVLIPIALDGIPCTGLDASQHMLAALRAKSSVPTLRLVHAPMQRFDLRGDRFALIFSAFRVFQHLYTVQDQLDCLACVKRHLAPGGAFAFDVFSPRVARMGLLEEPETVDVRFEQDGESVARHVRVTREPIVQIQHVHFRYERTRNGEVVGNDEATFRMRWFHRYELEHLLARAGFSDVTFYGDFAKNPVGPDTPAFIAVAR